jgi:hypothetical protein
MKKEASLLHPVLVANKKQLFQFGIYINDPE